MADRIFRKAKNKHHPYTIIANTALHDAQLSWKATGLLAYLLSLPDNWHINLLDLSNRKTSKKVATVSAVQELILAGYIERERERDEKGHLKGIIYTVHEEPAAIRIATTVKNKQYGEFNIFEEDKWKRGERGNYEDPEAVLQ